MNDQMNDTVVASSIIEDEDWIISYHIKKLKTN